MLLGDIFLKIFSLWKPVATVSAMHFFHHFAIWVTQYRYEDVIEVLKFFTDDPWVRQYIPYSVTWLFHRAYKESITWFSWVGYRFREEARLWWLVYKYDVEFMEKFHYWVYAQKHPTDIAIQEMTQKLLLQDEYVVKRRFPFSDLGDYNDTAFVGLGLPKDVDYRYDPNDHYSGYEGVDTDSETEPTHPHKEPRIRFHNPERDYQHGKPHYYYADPSQYTDDDLPNNNTWRGRFNQNRKNKRGKFDLQESKSANLARFYDERDDSDLTDDEFDDDGNEYPQRISKNVAKDYQKSKSLQRMEEIVQNKRREKNKKNKKNKRQNDIDEINQDEEYQRLLREAEREKRKLEHKQRLRQEFDNDQRSEAHGTPIRTIWRDEKHKETQPYRFHHIDDPKDYL
jgi:hypothetical protein